MTKIHHKAQPPHEVSSPFHCSCQIILPYHTFSLTKIPSITSKRVKIPLHKWFSLVTLQKNPFSRFHYAVIAGQKHLKIGRAYWWILVKFPNPWDSSKATKEPCKDHCDLALDSSKYILNVSTTFLYIICQMNLNMPMKWQENFTH